MEIHHGKHHNGYTTNLNNAIARTDLEGKSIEDILTGLDLSNAAVRNNGGGYYNHSLFWSTMSPSGGGAPSGALAEAIDAAFGSFDALTRLVKRLPLGGSGWAWLCVHKGKVDVCSTPNQDNPLMPGIGCEGFPILGLDVGNIPVI